MKALAIAKAWPAHSRMAVIIVVVDLAFVITHLPLGKLSWGRHNSVNLWGCGRNLTVFIFLLCWMKHVTRWTIHQKEFSRTSEQMGMNISQSGWARGRHFISTHCSKWYCCRPEKLTSGDRLRRPFVYWSAEEKAMHRTHSTWRVWR